MGSVDDPSESDLVLEQTEGVLRVDLRKVPTNVQETLKVLAQLLGAAAEVEDPLPENLQEFASRFLGVEGPDVATVSRELAGTDIALVSVAIARMLDRIPSAIRRDDTGRSQPSYQPIAVDIDTIVSAPSDLAACIPGREEGHSDLDSPAFDFDAVLVFHHNYPKKVSILCRREHKDDATWALHDLVERAVGVDNFYRGQTLSVSGPNGTAVFKHITPTPASRTDVIQRPQVWAEIDANIRGLATFGHLLVNAGFGASRGLLIVGPPGVGKTALCRVIATELPKGTTTIVVDPTISSEGLADLYQSLPRLSPAAVILDDLDLLGGGHRDSGSGSSLRTLLTSLDGFTPTESVVTIATTNDTSALDPALIRSGRFDSVIEINLPEASTREEILHRYLDPFGSFDLRQAARLTEGTNGADLREIVRRAILEHGEDLSEELILDVITTGRWKPALPTGQYL